jgi:hypothetical protein
MYLLGSSPFPFDSSSSITFLLYPNFLCFPYISSGSLFIWSCFGLLTAFLTVYTQIPNTSLHPVGRPRNTCLPPGFPSGRSRAGQPRRRPVGTIANMAPSKPTQQKKTSKPAVYPRDQPKASLSEEDTNDSEWLVDALVGKRFLDGTTQYLVRWRGDWTGHPVDDSGEACRCRRRGRTRCIRAGKWRK